MSSTDQSQQGWRCASCGAEHVGLAVAFGTPAPAPWEWASPEERAAGELNADMCVLPGPDGSSFYLRGQLEIPVVDAEIDRFVWGVWVSLSEANMQITADHWQDPERASLAPMFGWLCTALDYEQPTVGLAAIVHTRPPGQTPWIELDPTASHPLVGEQRDGISLHRVAEINAKVLRSA